MSIQAPGVEVRGTVRELLVEAYLAARRMIEDRGFDPEVAWLEEVSVASITEAEFLRESAWVILNSGFRTAVVERHFPSISRAFLEWTSASEIVRHAPRCRRQALRVFASTRKIGAIIDVASIVQQLGFEEIRRRTTVLGTEFLGTLPLIGPITRDHLAKNLGIRTAKADRHLRRVAELAGFASPYELCSTIEAIVGDSVSVVDLVIWRSVTLAPGFWPKVLTPSASLANDLRDLFG